MTRTKTIPESANSITEGIINMILNDGYSARRINTTGIFREELQQYTRSGMEPGFSDIIACIAGMYVAIEVKFKRDRMRTGQQIFQKEVEQAGGIYVVIKTWEQWQEWYKELNYHFEETIAAHKKSHANEW